MKRFALVLAVCLICCFCAVGFTACSQSNSENNKEVVNEDDQNKEKVDNNSENNNSVNNSGNENNNESVVLKPTSNEYFTFTLLDNDTYEIKAKDVNNMPAEVIIPANYNGKAVAGIGSSAFEDCSSLTSITIGENSKLKSIGEKAFIRCSSLTSVTIGSSVTNIGDYAFARCSSLTSVTIGSSVTSIGYYAFIYCSSLTSITIPDSVTSIGGFVFGVFRSAFENCSSLTSINVDENNEYYKSIDGNLYSKDGTTLIQYAIGKTATEFTIPDSVTSIGSYAFYGCSSLTSITIPNSITSIGYAAIYGLNSLTTVYYKGTAEEWDNISSIALSNYGLTNATRYYYSETAPTSTGNYWHYGADGITPVVWE